ncbi:MAG: hypothetical protein JWN94_96 [Betaproteobacteria bacterium]|nr:hypothetical protein [Betaproteobacteria bacterium]
MTSHDSSGAASAIASTHLQQIKNIRAKQPQVGDIASLLKTVVLIILFIGAGLSSDYSVAAPKFGRTAGTWGTNGNWSSASCAAAGATTFPTSADDVTICNGITISVDAARTAASVTIATGGTATGLTFAGGSSLIVTNDVTINAPTATVTKQIAVADRVLTVGGNLVINGGSAGGGGGNLASVSATSGTITVTGDATLNAGAVQSTAVLTVTNTGTISVGGNLALNGSNVANNTAATASVTATGNLNVAGDVSITGGNGSATRDALLTTNNGAITVTGNLRLAPSSTAGSATASISGTGTIIVNGVAGVTNGDTITVGAGTFTVSSPGATFSNSNTTLVASTTVSTGLLNIAGNLTNSSTVAGTGTDSILLSGVGTITVGGTLTNNTNASTSGLITTSTTGTINANGDFVNNGTFVHSAAGRLNLRGANATMNGTFTRTLTTGIVTSNKLTAGTQTLSGTALAFSNLLMNSVNGVTLSSTATVNTTLTLTSGTIVTGANRVVLGTAATVPTQGASSYVAGFVQKNYSAAGTLTFPVGDANNYTPVTIQGTAGFTAGSLTISTTGTDHPQVTAPIASTGIDALQSVNRFWTLTAAGLPVASTYNATFNFIPGTPVDLDAGASTSNFIVERYNGTNWNPTTLGAAGASSTSVTGVVNAYGDFAIGEPIAGITAVPGLYNVFETSTPAGSILGKIQTKIAGVGFTLDVVHINATKTAVSPVAVTVEVRLLDSSSGGVLDVNGCNAGWPLIQAQANFSIPASGRGTLPAVTVNNSYRDVRFQIRSPVGGPYTQIGCSTDRFAIRPQSLTVSALDLDWQSAGTARALANVTASGGIVHKASESTAATPRPFTLRATPVPASATNYNGNPTAVAGFPSCTGLGALCTSPGILGIASASWTSAGSGVRENATANYSEVGSFNLQLVDSNYASVDSVDGTPAATLTIPATATVQIGRFVPDHFDVTAAVTPTFKTFNALDTSCTGTGPKRTFTYIGQPFGYSTIPQFTIIARNAAGTTTANYRGTLWKIGVGGVSAAAKNCTTAPDANTCVLTTTFGATGGLVTETYTYSLLPVSTPAPGWDNNGASPATASVVSNSNGTGTVTYTLSDLLAFTRSPALPQALFTASINNTVAASDNAEGATQVITTASPLVISAIAFDSGNEFRYGRLRLQNANGSELISMPVPIQTQYWNGTGFVTNGADNCTTVTGSVTVGNPQPPAFTIGAPTVGGAFSAGIGSLRLPAPGAGNRGSVDVTGDLTGAAKTYLQGAWSGATYTDNPSARATFGTYRNSDKFIYQRENY